jgi:hypothetical protein
MGSVRHDNGRAGCGQRRRGASPQGCNSDFYGNLSAQQSVIKGHDEDRGQRYPRAVGQVNGGVSVKARRYSWVDYGSRPWTI